MLHQSWSNFQYLSKLSFWAENPAPKNQQVFPTLERIQQMKSTCAALNLGFSTTKLIARRPDKLLQDQGTRLRNHMDVSENSGTPKSSILIGFSIINHPFWVPLFLETPI